MLVEFRFRNVFSFKDDVTFLMTQVKSFKELLDTNVIITGKDFNLLKTAVIYGANGSGKSSFISALGIMGTFIHSSFSESLKKDGESKLPSDFQFKLSTATENMSSMFEISFILDDAIYRYGFEILNRLVISEWLYKKVDREVLLFFRDRQKFQINKESFAEGEKNKNQVNENVLFISHLAQFNRPVSKQLFSWFNKLVGISGIDESYSDATRRLLRRSSEFKNWVANALRYLEIVNVEAGDKDGEIVVYHNKYDENRLLIGAVPFDLSLESHGTQKLIDILGPIYVTLRNGGVLFIDELDCKLHPNLSRKLLNLFQDYNKNGAQFIFTAQDTSLLDKSLLRRDQIWFVEKNQFGESSLFPLSEFSSSVVRNNSDFEKKYLDNQFGAADTMEITEKLTSLLYE